MAYKMNYTNTNLLQNSSLAQTARTLVALIRTAFSVMFNTLTTTGMTFSSLRVRRVRLLYANSCRAPRVLARTWKISHDISLAELASCRAPRVFARTWKICNDISLTQLALLAFNYQTRAQHAPRVLARTWKVMISAWQSWNCAEHRGHWLNPDISLV